MFKVRRKIGRTTAVAAVIVLLCAAAAFPQKTEHYNSPLYSPRKYDPSQSAGTGLPDALKKIGIEQKLGAQMPLETEFKDENGQDRKARRLFQQRPAGNTCIRLLRMPDAVQ